MQLASTCHSSSTMGQAVGKHLWPNLAVSGLNGWGESVEFIGGCTLSTILVRKVGVGMGTEWERGWPEWLCPSARTQKGGRMLLWAQCPANSNRDAIVRVGRYGWVQVVMEERRRWTRGKCTSVQMSVHLRLWMEHGEEVVSSRLNTGWYRPKSCWGLVKAIHLFRLGCVKALSHLDDLANVFNE